MLALRSAGLVAVWVALLSAAACGGDDDDDGAAVDAGASVDAAANGDGGADVGPSLAMLAAAAAEEMCPRFFDCCSATDLGELFDEAAGGPPADAAACVPALTMLLDEEVVELMASVAAGRLAYDPARMATCLERLGGSSCGEFQQGLEELFTIPGCEPPLVPLVDGGGACAADRECRSGFCPGRVDEGLGACAALPGDGDACEYACADGLVCDSISQTCIPQRADGEECAGDEQCVSGACVGEVCGASSLCDGEG